MKSTSQNSHRKQKSKFHRAYSTFTTEKDTCSLENTEDINDKFIHIKYYRDL